MSGNDEGTPRAGWIAASCILGIGVGTMLAAVVQGTAIPLVPTGALFAVLGVVLLIAFWARS